MPTRDTCVSTGTSRIPSANSSTQAAVLRPTPGSELRYCCASGTLSVCEPVERQLAVWRGVGDRAQDRLDPRRLDLRDPAGPDRLLDLVDRRVADRLPRVVGKALAQSQIRDVAVAVVGRLRQHGQHQLGDRVAVRLGLRDRRRPCARRSRIARTRRGGRLSSTLNLRAPRAHRRGRYPRLRVSVDEHTIELAGSPAFYRTASGPTCPPSTSTGCRPARTTGSRSSSGPAASPRT